MYHKTGITYTNKSISENLKIKPATTKLSWIEKNIQRETKINSYMDGRFLPVETDQTRGWLKKQIQVYDNMCALNPMYFKLKRLAIFITDKIR